MEEVLINFKDAIEGWLEVANGHDVDTRFCDQDVGHQDFQNLLPNEAQIPGFGEFAATQTKPADPGWD